MSHQGGQNRRRKPGPHAARPMVGQMVLRTAACVEAAASALGTVDARSVCIEQVGDALATASTPDGVLTSTVEQVVIEALTELTGVDDLANTWANPSEALMELPDDLNSVAGVAEHLRWMRIDGERIAWFIIGYESMRHYPLVLREANRMAASWPGRTPEELIGYAWWGLRLALRSYRPDQYLFSTYACPKIRGTIRDGLRSESHLPKRLTTLVSSVETGRDELTFRLGRHPTLEELARHLDLTLEQLRPLDRYATPASLDETYRDDDSRSGRQIVDPHDVEDEALAHLQSEAVREAIAELPNDESDVIRLLFLNEEPTATVAQHLGITVRQVRSRRDRALGRLSEQLTMWRQPA